MLIAAADSNIAVTMKRRFLDLEVSFDEFLEITVPDTHVIKNR